MAAVVDTVIAILIGIITISSIFVNVWLVNARSYYKLSMRLEEHQVEFWRGTALLYQKQIHEIYERRL